MVTTGPLYEALDELVVQAATLRDEFSEGDGDFAQLTNDLSNLGSRSYALSEQVGEVRSALANIKPAVS